MTRAFLRLTLAAALTLPFVVGVGAQQPGQPVFRSSVELTSIDLGVVDSKGEVVTDPKPEEFSVRVDGSARRVVSAEWIGLETKEQPPQPPAPTGYTGNEDATGGRLIMLVVDEPNIRFGGTLGIRSRSTRSSIICGRPDRAAIIGIGPGALHAVYVRPRAPEACSGAVERASPEQPVSEFNISLMEALQIQRGHPWCPADRRARMPPDADRPSTRQIEAYSTKPKSVR